MGWLSPGPTNKKASPCEGLAFERLPGQKPEKQHSTNKCTDLRCRRQLQKYWECYSVIKTSQQLSESQRDRRHFAAAIRSFGIGYGGLPAMRVEFISNLSVICSLHIPQDHCGLGRGGVSSKR